MLKTWKTQWKLPLFFTISVEYPVEKVENPVNSSFFYA